MKRTLLIITLLLITTVASFGQGKTIQAYPNEPTAAKRTVCFYLVDATDLATPETGEAGGQPQISVNNAAWTNTGIGTLSAISSGTNGDYCAAVTQATIAADALIRTRYKSANTTEAKGDMIQVTLGVWSGTAQAGAAGPPSTITLDSSASATNNIFVNRTIEIVSGTGAGQGFRIITLYVGSTKVATVNRAWTTTPDNTSVFRIK